MKIRTGQKKQYPTSKWQGGSTTELLVLPEGSSFAARNFQLRISMARVLGPEGSFTPMKGYRRNLLMLEGAMLLHGQKGIRLVLPGDEIKFSGSESISSKGSGTDFNVMLRKGRAAVQMLSLAAGEAVILDQSVSGQLVHFFAWKGAVQIRIGKLKYRLEKGDTLWIEELDSAAEIILIAEKKSVVILTEAVGFGE